MNCYKGSINISNSDNKITIKEITNYDWKLFQSCWDINPSWQNDINAIDNNKYNLLLLGAYMDNKFAGYLIFNTYNNRIHQFAIKKDFRNKYIASSLFLHIKDNYSENVSITNVDDTSKSINLFLESIGLENFLQQYEMEI